MSNIVEKNPFQPDMTLDERSKLQEYVEAGIPGISKVSEEEILQAYNLYMTGRSYEEIAQKMGISLNKILFLSNKFDWHDKRSRYIENILSKVGNKMQSVKVEGLSFLLDLTSFFHKHQGSAIEDFLKTNDPDAAKKVDLKSLDKYFKTIDALSKMANLPNAWEDAAKIKNANHPSVNINLNMGDARIEKQADGTVSISGSDSSILKELAEIKRLKTNKENE